MHHSHSVVFLGILAYSPFLVTSQEVKPFRVPGFQPHINPDIQSMSRRERIQYEREQVNYWTEIVPTSPCTYENCCYMDQNETCAFQDLDRTSGKSTFIYPHEDFQPTKCLDANDPYSFQVYPRDTDKVIIMFQGAGACPSETLTNKFDTCSHTTRTGTGHDGIFARDNINNPYLNHTIVHVRYCSGDWHVGDAQMNYTRTARDEGDIEDSPAEHRGAQNARVVLNWLKDDCSLQAEPLKELLVMGCSAGAFGLQIWASDVLSEIKAERKAVIVDSLVGIFPDADAQQHFFQTENVCGTGLLQWNPKLQHQCEAGSLEFESILEETMKEHPETTFVMINPKKDPYQVGAYNGWKVYRDGMIQAPIRFKKLLRKMYDRTSRYSKQPNFASYWVNGVGHCYVNTHFLYRATVEGTFRFGNNPSSPSLLSWVNQLPLEKGETIHSQCSGKPLDITGGQTMWWGINNYCLPLEKKPSTQF